MLRRSIEASVCAWGMRAIRGDEPHGLAGQMAEWVASLEVAGHESAVHDYVRAGCWECCVIADSCVGGLRGHRLVRTRTRPLSRRLSCLCLVACELLFRCRMWIRSRVVRHGVLFV
eukprot:5300415-Prymnesium_polylepis.1